VEVGALLSPFSGCFSVQVHSFVDLVSCASSTSNAWLGAWMYRDCKALRSMVVQTAAEMPPPRHPFLSPTRLHGTYDTLALRRFLRGFSISHFGAPSIWGLGFGKLSNECFR
jgi:hypothetical protein